MKRAYGIALIIIVTLVVASLAVIWASVILFPVHPASEVTPPSNNNQPSTHPGEQPTPTPSSPPSVATITIQYEGVTSNSLVDKYGLTDTPDAGNVWLVINMTINNKGYEEFSANPFYFSVVINNIEYSYDLETYSYGNWNTINILDGGSYTGTLVFQVPSSATSFTLQYERFGETYHIVYQ